MSLDLVVSFGQSCTWRNVAHSKNSSESTQLAKTGRSPFCFFKIIFKFSFVEAYVGPELNTEKVCFWKLCII